MTLWIKKYSSGIAIASLIIFCMLIIYSWIDTLVSLSYARQELADRHREIEVFQSLLLETSKRMSRSEIEQMATKRFGKNYIVKKDEQNELSIDSIILKFQDDVLVEVKLMN